MSCLGAKPPVMDQSTDLRFPSTNSSPSPVSRSSTPRSGDLAAARQDKRSATWVRLTLSATVRHASGLWHWFPAWARRATYAAWPRDPWETTMRTGTDYRTSLRDGRRVWVMNDGLVED